ncbi:urease accessory protein UreD [Paraburkholderia unamae]|uniref:Urease accessory protein UreD n=1 Tax=Paraburkholderia unamae TaxID=219649 RepID=A0ABX5KPT4_9BURK|nr:urease accessory protein UreD [Paraburkholderia unamae]PVX81730.1 urease accessory protein [Paraburkholderia unamae]
MRIDAMPQPPQSGVNEPQLDLCFTRGPSGAVYLSRQRAGYPFHVGRMLDAASGGRVIVQSTSGGLFEGEDVAQHVVATQGAQARVETAAATIVHSMTHGMARSRVRLEAMPGAQIEWLPQPSILFPGARLVSHIDAVLHPGARMLLMDSYMSHDPSGGAQPFGVLEASIDVRSAAGRLLARDAFRLAGSASRPSGAVLRPLGGVRAPFAVHGGLMVLTLDAHEATAALHALETLARHTCYAGASLLPNGCGAFMRLLAVDGQTMRAAMQQAVEAVRERMMEALTSTQGAGNAPIPNIARDKERA